ncbi:protein MEMO1 isoform X1 [Neomonachus schauinslandi]|uniref:Protein MEMO1 n=1 Tax=Neomonachus schauinslandi TaxID=29088 RepID=A0A8M1MMI0_NEOSC|nr:protein MEMO1 isoform X1 [Neomonachus schauinslandi]
MLSGQDPLEWRVRKRWLFSGSAFPGSGPGPGLLCERSCSRRCLLAGPPDPRCRLACPVSAVNLAARLEEERGGAGPAGRRPGGQEGPAGGGGGTGTKMSNRVVCREASHAGSWYTASGPQLNAQLEGWLSQVQSTKRPARAIIAPHAGYTYCGSCAAHAYKQVDPSITRRIFILGPSHHVPLSRCALSSVDIYRTPLYDLRIDQKIYGELWKTGMFERMSLQTDEDEHSIEMHLPYTAKAMESHKDEFTIIPVLVGALSESKEQEFGKLFSKYLADPSNLFVVSSDFCHWGQRFRYSYYDESQGEIYRSIEHLDKMGMSIIEQLDPVSFSNYLKKYHNTICGRHPIGVLLNAITELQKNGMNMSFSFLNYAQSSQCRNWQDSSVSYAAGALTVH